MFTYDKEQRVFNIAGSYIGGQPGQNPPLMVGNMFQKGDKLLESRKEGKFDRKKATERICELEQTVQETGIPGLVGLVANTADEMKTYIDFYTGVTDLPFSIDIWVQKTRIAAARYVSEMGLQARCLYNSITPWDEDIVSQVAEIKELGIKHLVIQVFDTADLSPQGRVKSLRKMLPLVEKGDFESILIDTSVMNLPTTSLSLMANHLIKKEFGLPVGFAPSNGSYMYRKAAGETGRKNFRYVDAAVHAISAMLSDVIFYGPMSGTERVFPAVATASSMLAAALFEDKGILPSGKHPLNKFFPDVVAQFEKSKVEEK